MARTTAVFTDLLSESLEARIEEYNNANVSEGTNWSVKHLISVLVEDRDGQMLEYYTLVLERD